MRTDEWIGLVLGLAAVAVAGWLARRRAARPQKTTVSRANRVFWTAFTFGLVQVMLYATFVLSRPGGAGQLLDNLISLLLVFTFGSMLLFALVELVLGLFRPERSRHWLTVALLVFALAAVAGLAVPVWLAQGDVTLRPGQTLLLASAVAAALTWWSLLPAERRKPLG